MQGMDMDMQVGTRGHAGPFAWISIFSAETICSIIIDDLSPNRGRFIRFLAGWTRFMHFYTVFIYILQPADRKHGW